MGRNWMAIAAIKDHPTREAISLAMDPEIIARYKAGWPECFEEGEDTGPLRIPLSVLRAAVREAFRAPSCPDGMGETLDFALCFWLTSAWQKRPDLSLPIVAFGPEHDAGIPSGMAGQFVGQTPNNLINLIWGGQRHVVVWADFDLPPGELYSESRRPNGLIELNKPFSAPPRLRAFGMVLAEFIDLTA